MSEQSPRRAIPLTVLYEKRMNGGRTVHLVGRLGQSRVLVTPGGATSDGAAIYRLYLVEGDAPAAKPAPAEKIGPAATARQRAEAQFLRRP
jgi:hypothetical protein